MKEIFILKILHFDQAILLIQILFLTGVLGIKVKIMLPWDPNGKIGPKKPLPDHVSIVEPKEDVPQPAVDQMGSMPKPVEPAAAAAPTAAPAAAPAPPPAV